MLTDIRWKKKKAWFNKKHFAAWAAPCHTTQTIHLFLWISWRSACLFQLTSVNINSMLLFLASCSLNVPHSVEGKGIGFPRNSYILLDTFWFPFWILQSSRLKLQQLLWLALLARFAPVEGYDCEGNSKN